MRKLERASAADPHNARTWSDLTAAYLVRAQRAEDPRDLLRAYGASERALQEDGSLPEERFNRALALERLFLLPEALAAWQSYLDLDGTSDWAKEARKHQRDLSQPTAQSTGEEQEQRLERAALAGRRDEVEKIVDQHRQAVREYAEQELFGLWADAAAQGRQDLAADRLQVLRAVGDALVKVDGEHLIQDAVGVIDKTATAGDAGRWQALVRACRIFRDGYQAYNARSLGLAVPALAAAQESLSRAGSPLAVRAEFLLVCCDYIEGRFVRALSAEEKLAREVEGLAYPGLRGHVWRMKAVLEATLGEMKASIEDYEKMQAEYRLLGEEENLAGADCLLGESLTLIGRGQEAWRSIYQALRETPRIRDSKALANIFMIAGNAALRDGADAAALAFERERLRFALASDSYAAVEALTWLARMQGHRGDREGALATLREARQRSERLPLDSRRRKQADIAMIEGSLQVEEGPLRAIDLLTSALAVYQKDNNFIFSLRTLLDRGRAYRQSGNDADAERDLDAALNLYDRMGEQLSKEDLRLALLEETDEVFDEMVSLQAGRDPDRAFAYADRARTRVLPGCASKLWTGGTTETSRLLAAEPQSLPLIEIRRRLPAGVTLIQYSVLPDRVLIWRVRRDGAGKDFFVRSIPRDELEAVAARLQDLDHPGWETAAETLFDLLVRPWLGAVPPEERIVFIPDKILHRVPFAILKDRSTRRLLLEGHPLAVAPSATLYVNALERQGTKKRTVEGPGLVIGEPAIDHALFFDLPSLPESAAEARQVADLTGSRLLVGDAARKSAFLAEAPQAEWIHFSGHALIDPRSPLSSKLVLAPEGEGETGALTAQEIYSLKLGATRLVVLAACETGNEYMPGSEGVTSLARAFLAAGVPTVVASLWSVDDRATADLFDAFHHRLLAGDDPVEALRNAQLGMLRGGNPADRPPRAWAAFEVIGASVQ